MKKLFFLLALWIPIVSFAQNHLEFRGVPIDGHINTFVSKMNKIGYSEVYRNESGAIMKGKFTNQDAELIIVATAKSKTVWKVAAHLDEDASWSKLKSDYFEYVNLYISKYGQPSNHFEFFSSPYYEGDGFELQALKNDKCHYATYFTTDNGTLSVSISSSGNLSLSYEDNINANLMTKEKQSSALDDI